MIPRYEIQGRLLERSDGRVIRDEVRHASSDSIEEAKRQAQTFTKAGFTVWIFEVRPGGLSPQYELLQRIRPLQAEASPPSTSAIGEVIEDR